MGVCRPRKGTTCLEGVAGNPTMKTLAPGGPRHPGGCWTCQGFRAVGDGSPFAVGPPHPQPPQLAFDNQKAQWPAY